MTLLLLPNIFHFILKTFATLLAISDIGFRYLEQDFPIEFFGWIQYIFAPTLYFTVESCASFLYGILSIPIYFWNLIWHPNGRSIIDMLSNPKGNRRFVQSKETRCYCWRERACSIPQWVRRRRRIQFHWSQSTSFQCRTVIKGYDSRLCLFSFYQMHPTSITKTDGGSSSEDGITVDVNLCGTQWIQCRVSNFRISGNSRSNFPPRGFISYFLVFLTTIGIIAILTGMKCHKILSCSMTKGAAISSASEGVGDSFLLPSVGECNPKGFATSFADADSENMNMQVHFDTDSIFFVCDNSTTGHICYDLKKFVPGSLRQSNKSLTTANGTGPCLQEGTVQLQLVDDDGQKHIFILDNCLFHPSSPVNLLSTRRLAEKFLDSNGYPDEQT
jgi:hypothetical protein